VTSALEGIKIVDLTRHMAGPYATVLLGDFGADVVKVESTPTGDPSRTMGTAFVDGESGMFLVWNRSKRSIALDLRTPEAQAIVRRLVSEADVFIENYRPGVTEEMGVGYEAMSALNPRLIYLSISAFGPTGPLAKYPGTDPVVQAVSGVMSLTGEKGGGPVLVGIPVADFTAAMMGVQAVLLGLLARERTGRGQRIDLPMVGALVYGLSTRLASYWADGKDPVRNGSAHSVVAPYQAYRAKDGDVVAGAWAEDAWPRFCRAIDRADLVSDSRFRTNPDRIRNFDELNTLLGGIFLQKTVAEWEERFHDASALFSPVYSISQILNHPQMATLGMVQTMEHAKLGSIPQLGPPILMSDTPGKLVRPPPLYGQHTAEILQEVGFTQAEIDNLTANKIVHTAR
jgi:crotonobetainyl-CoA:carnitine CoA-transferase CaiB-like acyl-CoA transferase